MRDSVILGEYRPKCKITYQAFFLVEQKSRIVTRAAKDEIACNMNVKNIHRMIK